LIDCRHCVLNLFAQYRGTPVPVKWSAEYIKHNFPCNIYFNDFGDVASKTVFYPFRMENTGEESTTTGSKKALAKRCQRRSRLDLLRISSNAGKQTVNGWFRQRRTGNNPVTFWKTEIRSTAAGLEKEILRDAARQFRRVSEGQTENSPAF
jgi:hypothetical protein